MTSPPGAGLDSIARIRGGDRPAFEALFREHYSALCEFAHRYVQSREAAEDLVQEVFLSVWTHRESLEIRDGLRAYLYGAVRNRALNSIEHRRVEQRWEERARREHASTPAAAEGDSDDAEAVAATV